MNEREKVLLDVALDKLRIVGHGLVSQGWQPSLVVFGPDEPDGELARIPGYKVALVVPLDTVPYTAPGTGATKDGTDPGVLVAETNT